MVRDERKIPDPIQVFFAQGAAFFSCFSLLTAPVFLVEGKYSAAFLYSALMLLILFRAVRVLRAARDASRQNSDAGASEQQGSKIDGQL
jgi:hypothetical protein